MRSNYRTCLLLLNLFFLATVCHLAAHPIPDLPVRSWFNEDGSVEIRVEVDPRSSTDDPEALDYYLKSHIEELNEAEIQEMKDRADMFTRQRIQFLFAPDGAKTPNFTWEFRKLADEPWLAPDDITVLVGSWKFQLDGETKYQIRALELDDFSMGIPLNVVYLNFLNKIQTERYAVLFPGETSFSLDLTTSFAKTEGSDQPAGVKAAKGDLMEIFTSEVKRGFLHVIPLGMDHILFVLGMFLMTRKWKPLLLQVSAFTVAHTLTLWLASAGWVNLPPKIVEPIIAASIVVVAVENIFQKEYRHWRLLIVFSFGLIHGLGFAGVMSTKLDSTQSLLVGLVGINIGVEIAQIGIIIAALILTSFVAKNPAVYRKFVVIPGSILIAAAGIWWVLERTVL
ncbi:MAG: HupE/UreJ family protein [Verrucomicrobiales bacterium]|nr:HupE/UreJ family protein [Verrucomicrobiales bacterium]